MGPPGNELDGALGPLAGDVTNQYVVVGITGGLAALALFIYMIVLAYRGVDISRRASEGSRAASVASWAMGVTLFLHTMMFLSVSYFGQIILVWYLLLATIASLARVRKRASTPEAAPAPAGEAVDSARSAALGAGLRGRPAPGLDSLTSVTGHTGGIGEDSRVHSLPAGVCGGTE